MYADTIIKNGRCLTMCGDNEVGWVAVAGKMICATGDGDEWQRLVRPDTLVIDAHGASVLPGFIDNHFHVMQTAINMMSVDLSAARSHRELGEMLAAAEAREGAILGCQIEESQFAEKRFPDRYVLDKYCSDHPVVIFSKEYHVSMLNTHALLYYKVPFSLDGVELDSNALPTGVFRHNANYVLRSNVLRNLPDEFRMEAIHLAMSRLLENGITTVAAIEGGWLFDDRDAEFIYAHSGEFPVDMPLFYQTMDLAKVWKLGLRRVGGNIMVDGTLASHSAALMTPYADRPGDRGRIFLPQDTLDEFVQQCYEQDMQLALYSIGDRAIESVLQAHERAIQLGGSPTQRHRVEHAILATHEQIARAAEMRLIFSVQPTYEYLWGGKGGMYESRIGERYRRTNDFAAMFAAGVVVCGGSDSDVTEPRPLLGIHASVNRAVPEHDLTIRQAIEMYTVNGAYALFEDKRKGMLMPGYLADIVVLDRDILRAPKEQLEQTCVTVTIKSGSVLYGQQ